LVGELSSKIEIVENEMDIRVESLISSIHNYRDECKKKLDLIIDDFKR
jgi:ATP/maltotriose-dependent transcriptional regulator MalT